MTNQLVPQRHDLQVQRDARTKNRSECSREATTDTMRRAYSEWPATSIATTTYRVSGRHNSPVQINIQTG